MKRLHAVARGGRYYRIAAPAWKDPADTSYSKDRGGRWNPAGEFGALYLNATVEVAAANARAQHAKRAIKLFDLLPKARPQLVAFDVPRIKVLDVWTVKGVSSLGFASSFPYGVGWPPCQAVAREAHTAGLSGVASRSAAEVTASSCIGEELAVFDTISVGDPIERRTFDEWYPDPIPG